MTILRAGRRPGLWQFRSGIHRLSKPRLGKFAYLGTNRRRADEGDEKCDDCKRKVETVTFHSVPLKIGGRASVQLPILLPPPVYLLPPTINSLPSATLTVSAAPRVATFLPGVALIVTILPMFETRSDR